MMIHPIFHFSLLEPVPNDPLPGQAIPPPPLIEVEGQEEWEVVEVLDSRHYRRRIQSLVKWLGWDDATWQPTTNLVNSPADVELFNCLHPTKPGAW